MHITIFKIFTHSSAFSFSLQSPSTEVLRELSQFSTNLSGEVNFCSAARPQLFEEVLVVKGADITHWQRQDTTQYEPIHIEQSLL